MNLTAAEMRSQRDDMGVCVFGKVHDGCLTAAFAGGSMVPEKTFPSHLIVRRCRLQTPR